MRSRKVNAKWGLSPDSFRPSPRREPTKRHPIVAGRGGFRGGILIPPRSQKGQAIVLVALMLVVVVGMAALAIDGSRGYALRRDLQAGVDAAVLAAGDTFQRSGNYATAEQAASTSFGVNLRLYQAPSCAPGYGTPGAAGYTVTCTYSDGTTLTDTVQAEGPRGTMFQLTAARNLTLQFGRILTNGSTPRVSATGTGRVNNLLYSPALAALGQNGCGGTSGTALTVNGFGTLSVTGDVVSNGAIAVASGSANVAGDTYARCQSSVSGMTNRCYPSGAPTPCTFPDVAGATRQGYTFADPAYPAPTVVGGSQPGPSSNTLLLPGVYASVPAFTSGKCWFLAGGVYDWAAGYANSADFVSNELKPPDEPVVGNNTLRSPNQFWDTGSVNCSGAVQVSQVSGPRGIPVGNWAFVVTSTRTDTYGGVSYPRESAPSMCYPINVNNSGINIKIVVSNLPGPSAYNIYAAPPNNGCNGPFGLAETLAVAGTVDNTNTHNMGNPCPQFIGNSCSLGHESMTLDSTDLGAPFAPNALAAAGTFGAYPPNSETAPLAAGLPNQNPPRLAGAAGDRANENNCESGGAYVSCPAAVTPGAVVFYLPSAACMNSTNGGDTYVFSGYQYNWMSLYEPGVGSPPANTCSNAIGADTMSAFIGLTYMPAASLSLTSPVVFESPGIGGIIAARITITGALPAINYSSGVAPVPFSARLVG